MMKPKISSWLLAILFLATLPFAEAQQGRKIPWIGYLAGSGSAPNQAFVQGMRDLGYIEGKNIAFIYRTAEGRRERYSELAAELGRLKVDVIVTDVTGAGLALKKATSAIPIVMTSSTDPVGTGLVASLARPSGNVTGLTNVGGEIGGKLLELLKEITPRLSRAAILGTAGGGADEVFAKETEVPARAMGVELIRLRLRARTTSTAHFEGSRKNGLTVFSCVSNHLSFLLITSG
jgi:putative tryptophan/tyrosine transport system substrate-binding protein